MSTRADADRELKVAWRTIAEVRDRLSEFEAAVSRIAMEVDQSDSLLDGVRGEWRIGQEKAAVLEELELAGEQINRARTLSHDATIVVEDGEMGEVELGPTEMQAFLHQIRALVSLGAGDLADAEQEALKANSLFETQSGLLFLGFLELDMGKRARALEYFSKAVDLDPDSEDGVEALQHVRRLERRGAKGPGFWLDWVPTGVLKGLSYVGGLAWFFVGLFSVMRISSRTSGLSEIAWASGRDKVKVSFYFLLGVFFVLFVLIAPVASGA